MTYLKYILIILVLPILLAACQSAGYHRQSVEDTAGDRVTVGPVQREVRVGMSGADVAQTLGSPNVVTTDEQRREVWIYDRISTTSVYSTSSGSSSADASVGRLFLGVPALVFGGVNSRYEAESGASTTTQKTFTVVIKYDEQGLVRDFAYHTSRF